MKSIWDKVATYDCDPDGTTIRELNKEIKKLRKDKDKLTTRLVSYEATIGYLKDALVDIKTRGTGIGGAACVTTQTLREIAKKALEGLKK